LGFHKDFSIENALRTAFLFTQRQNILVIDVQNLDTIWHSIFILNVRLGTFPREALKNNPHQIITLSSLLNQVPKKWVVSLLLAVTRREAQQEWQTPAPCWTEIWKV